MDFFDLDMIGSIKLTAVPNSVRQVVGFGVDNCPTEYMIRLNGGSGKWRRVYRDGVSGRCYFTLKAARQYLPDGWAEMS